ncbi:MAG: exodeoxyribonuclease VII small subunit [Puniceicoccales bacterium]
MSKTDTEKFSYEEAYSQLQEIVSRLEEDEPALDELVKDYERGMKLLKTCQKRLNEAALRIEKVREDEELSLEPFDEESTSKENPPQ